MEVTRCLSYIFIVEWLTNKDNRSQIQFNMFNPTKMDIKKEIINYRTKLQLKQQASSQKSLLPDYEPKVLILPKTNINDGNEFRSTEFVFSKKIKSEDKGKFEKKANTIYKARATLKTRIYSHNSVLDDRKMFASGSNLSYPTTSYFYPKFASFYGSSQSNSLCTILNRKKND